MPATASTATRGFARGAPRTSIHAYVSERFTLARATCAMGRPDKREADGDRLHS